MSETQNELVDLAQKAIANLPFQPHDSEMEYYWRCNVAKTVLKAHEEWLESQGLVVVPREASEEMVFAGDVKIKSVSRTAENGRIISLAQGASKLAWAVMILKATKRGNVNA